LERINETLIDWSVLYRSDPFVTFDRPALLSILSFTLLAIQHPAKKTLKLIRDYEEHPCGVAVHQRRGGLANGRISIWKRRLTRRSSTTMLWTALTTMTVLWLIFEVRCVRVRWWLRLPWWCRNVHRQHRTVKSSVVARGKAMVGGALATKMILVTCDARR